MTDKVGKTIEDLFREGECIFPLKLRMLNWKPNEYVHIIASSPNGHWIGWDEQGRGYLTAGDRAEWTHYYEAKEKVVRWLWAKRNNTAFSLPWVFTPGRGASTFLTVTEALELDQNLIKLEWSRTEFDE